MQAAVRSTYHAGLQQYMQTGLDITTLTHILLTDHMTRNTDLAGRSVTLNLVLEEAGGRLSGSDGQYMQNLGSDTSDLNTWYTLLRCWLTRTCRH